LEEQATNGKGAKGKAEPVIDLCVAARRGTSFPPEEEPAYPELTDADLTVLAQTTTPRPIDVSPWLHGFAEERAEVAIIWRDDLPEDTSEWGDYLKAIPPTAQELLTRRISSCRGWLQHATGPVGLWDGDDTTVMMGRDVELSPGVTLVVRSTDGGCDGWGWAPESTAKVDDHGDTAWRVRLHPALREDAAELLGDYDAGEISERELVKQAGITAKAWRLRAYSGGIVIITERGLAEQGAGDAVLLKDHSHGVEGYARRFAARIASPEAHEAIAKAALGHDGGKNDDSFQRALGGRGPVLAKSVARTREESREAWALSGLPKGWRHEVKSAALALARGEEDLTRYLIATHHGRGRCWLPAQPDQDAWAEAGGATWPEVYARLTDQYGTHGLAYLEAIVRLADWAQSREEAAQ
jgi:CRISPR-associated endonuclease/helicase Cas3